MVRQQALSPPWKRAVHSLRHSKTFSTCTYSGIGLKVHLHMSGTGLKLPLLISEMDKRGKRILSTATQDHTLKNHWVSKKNQLSPYLPRFLLLRSRGASENTHAVSLLGGLRFNRLPPTSATVEVSRARPLLTCRIPYQKAPHIAKCEVRKWTRTVCYAH